METHNARLKRILNGNEHEVPLTLFNSIRNIWLPQVVAAGESHLDGLVFLGTHSIMQTLGRFVFGISGRDATYFYLKNFVDGERDDLRFSTIADLLHDIRNVLAHQWMSVVGHEHAIDHREQLGFWNGSDGIHINPSIYLDSFRRRFPGNDPANDYRKFVSADQLVVRKYEFLSEWLQLKGSDSICKDVRKLKSLSGPELQALAERIRATISVRYKLGAS